MKFKDIVSYWESQRPFVERFDGISNETYIEEVGQFIPLTTMQKLLKEIEDLEARLERP